MSTETTNDRGLFVAQRFGVPLREHRLALLGLSRAIQMHLQKILIAQNQIQEAEEKLANGRKEIRSKQIFHGRKWLIGEAKRVKNEHDKTVNQAVQQTEKSVLAIESLHEHLAMQLDDTMNRGFDNLAKRFQNIQSNLLVAMIHPDEAEIPVVSMEANLQHDKNTPLQNLLTAARIRILQIIGEKKPIVQPAY